MIFGFLAVLLMANATDAETEKNTLITQTLLSELIEMDDDIYREPWLSLQKIMTLKAEVTGQPNEIKLWWHLRKAQCENLLYNYEEFDQTLTVIQPLINKMTDIEIQSRFFYFQGLSTQRAGAYIKSREFLKKAMLTAQQENLNALYVNAKLELAYTYSLAELFETSLKDMQEAYVEAFAMNDDFLLAKINETYGAIYGYMQDYGKSLEYYQKSLDTYEKLAYKAHIAEAIYGIATTYRYWKKYALASEAFKRYQQKISFTPNKNISYFSSYGLGMTLAEQGSCEEALRVINNAFTLKGLIDYDAELLKRKASCLVQLNRLEEAEQAINKAETIFLSLPELIGTAWHLEVEKIKASIAYAHGQYQKSYQQLELYHQQYTDLLIANSSSRLINARATLETERQEIEHALSTQRDKTERLELKAQEQQALQQKYFIIFLSVLLVIVMVVVSIQFRNNRKMAKLSITDSLSGLYNRRYIFDYLDKLIAATEIGKGELSILLIDIDDFKQINDHHGHPVGDTVIEAVARLTKETLRTEDVVGRIGGEEFLCVLPRADLVVSEIIAQRLRENVSKYPVKAGNAETINVTVSIGIAHINLDVTDSAQLYNLADQALYSAKAAGKNCVVTV